MHPRQRLHRKGHQRDFQKLDVGKDAAVPLPVGRACAIAERQSVDRAVLQQGSRIPPRRSEEHTSELQSTMRNSYAVLCLKKKKKRNKTPKHITTNNNSNK